MTTIFVSHASEDAVESRMFVDSVIRGYSGVSEGGVFYSSSSRVPFGSLMDSRIFSAEVDATIIIIYGTPSYFTSFYCAMEAGLSLSKSANVFSVLSPAVDFSDLPVHLKSFNWRYAHDSLMLDRLRQSIISEPSIDKLPRTLNATVDQENHRTAWLRWVEQHCDEADAHLTAYVDDYPHVIHHTPFHGHSLGRPNQAFGRVAWELEPDGRVVPVVWAGPNQTSLMNNDGFIRQMQELYECEEVLGLWPEADGLGVTTQSVGGGTTPGAEELLRKLGIPLPSEEAQSSPEEE